MKALHPKSNTSSARLSMLISTCTSATIGLGIAYHIIHATIASSTIAWSELGMACAGLSALVSAPMAVKAYQKKHEH